MAVLSLEEYANLNDDIEVKLDEADKQAASTDERFSHETVFRNVRRGIINRHSICNDFPEVGKIVKAGKK